MPAMRRLNVGFIGLGAMGRGMALNVLKAGFPLRVCDLDPAKVEALKAAGAADGGSPAGTAAGADVVVISAPNTEDVEAILFGPAGVVETGRAGAVVVDCSSISAVATRTFAARLAERGLDFVDAPVSGGVKGAEDGTLTLMMGGEEGVIARCRPLFEAIGKTLRHVGPVGAGQVAKACNQMIIAGTMLACAEALALCRKSGIDPLPVREALLGGAARSFVLENHAKKMIDGTFAPGFRAALMLKDLKLAANAGSGVGCFLPLTALAGQMMQALCNTGRGELDHSAIAMVLAELSGVVDAD